jgi:hypothetical protein
MQKWRKASPLRLWRLKEDLSYTEAAATIGCAAQTYSSYEWGWKFPKNKKVRIWNAGLSTFVTHRWDDLIVRHTNVTYEQMAAWHRRKPV